MSRLFRLSSALPALLAATLVCAKEPTDCVVVQPILVSGDDGRDAAKIHIVERWIDRVYAKANIDFHFLEPIELHDSTIRDGEIHVNEVVESARRRRLLRGDGRMINMFFVNAVNGKPAPNGLAQTPGSIVFIAQSPKSSRGEDAFVVAHESGHNLGLKHAVDDPKVPNDVSNLMGDGPFEERVGANGLTDYQVAVIRKSPLVRPRVECLDVDEGKYWITEDDFDPFFRDMQRREIATLTGKVVEGDIATCRETVAERFAAAVRAFEDAEKDAIATVVEGVRRRVQEHYPLLAEQPWRFLKVRRDLCGGFPHTRGLCIVFSEGVVSRIRELVERGGADEAVRRIGPLFVHEQMHVLQRCYPRKFAALYESQFGFVRASVESTSRLELRRIGNPDATRFEWVFAGWNASGEKRWYWPRTVLDGDRAVPRMGRDFRGVAVDVRSLGGGRFRVITDDHGVARTTPIGDLRWYREQFVTARGLDHPNEISAYAFARLFELEHFADDPGPPQAELESFRHWCRRQLTTRETERRRI